MKKLTTFLLLFCLATISAQDKLLGTIELEITNIDNGDGQMMIGLYDSEENWLNKIVIGKIGVIKNGGSKIVFENIPNGTYAISVFHDEDSNGKLKTLFGIPLEDTGSSNDAPAKFGPPLWEDAKFQLKGGTLKQTINL